MRISEGHSFGPRGSEDSLDKKPTIIDINEVKTKKGDATTKPKDGGVGEEGWGGDTRNDFKVQSSICSCGGKKDFASALKRASEERGEPSRLHEKGWCCSDVEKRMDQGGWVQCYGGCTAGDNSRRGGGGKRDGSLTRCGAEGQEV